ncbi:MAG: cysteine desulfurase family protein [Rhodoglobus sp.]
MMYLDSAATTETRREVLEAMWPYLTTEFGNPSSQHELGSAAARALSDARSRVARWFGARASEVIFTSGGTESNNLAIKGICLAQPRGRHIVTTAIEHEAVLESCRYLERYHDVELTILGVDSDGLVQIKDVIAALRPNTTLVTVMYANNEVGSVQPIDHIVEACRRYDIPVHTDAVQAAVSLDLSRIDADAISISGHKLGAPKGVGALYVRGRVPLEPLIHGGGQERGRRSGTENVAGAVALATAVDILKAEQPNPQQAQARDALRDRFIEEVLRLIPSAVLTGPRTPRLPGNASFCFPGTSGESLLLELERRGVVCSAGSACAVGNDEPSHVLTAMGFRAEIAQTAVRFSMDRSVTGEQLSAVAQHLAAARSSVVALGQ